MRTTLLLNGLWLLASTACLAPLGRAQQPYPYDPVQDPTALLGKSYHGSDIDLIDLDTGTLTVKIPLISYPQRGGNLPLDFTLVGALPGTVYGHYTVPYGQGRMIWLVCGPVPPPVGSICPVPSTAPGSPSTIFSGFPSLNTNTWTAGTSENYSESSIIEPDGSTHLVGWINATTNTSQGRALDGTGFFVNRNSQGYTITDKNGVTTNYTSGSNTIVMTDPNGNEMTYNDNSSTITDTMGRQIPVFGSNGNWTVPGLNGGTETFQFSQPSNTLSVVTLPNNTSYSFQYTIVTLPLLNQQTTAQTTTLLSGITLPTGGTISWTYAATPASSPCGSGGYYFPVMTRVVNANDGTGPHTWTYSYSLSSTSSGVTTVTDPLGNKSVYTYGLTSCVPYPTQVQKYDNIGNLVQTLTTTYSYVTVLSQGFTQYLNVNPTSVTTVWPNGQQSKVSHTYDRDNAFSFQFYTTLFYTDGQFSSFLGGGSGPAGYTSAPWTETATDYGSGAVGPVLRQTKTAYMAFTGPNASTYFANNLLSKPYTVQTLNGSGTQMSLTQYNYDESTLVSSGLTSNNQWTSLPPTGSYRGNNTSVYRWLNSGTLTCPGGGTGGSGSNVISKMTYFDAGMLHTSSDPCLNTNTYAYSLTYWATFPTTVTNALNQPTSHTYDFNTGLLTSSTDPNNLTTSYTYDNMWRLASQTAPDGGITTITHQETSFPFTAAVTKPINASPQNEIDVTVFDGLGRQTESQLTSDPQGTVYRDTTYDALGRVATVSNPYRKGTDITTSAGTTSYGYDALGRKTSVTYPDTNTVSVLTTAYCGASTLVTDPTKRWRRSRADGLGRLVEVDEPNAIGASVASTGCPGSGEPIWVTSYIFDALGNLTNVVQNGSHPRSFTYDSVSRLLCSSNPESATAACPAFGATSFPAGTVLYAYNPDSTILTKTDARAITTTYTYDALNRELTRTYSNGDPAVTTTYDQSACLALSACQNIGYRTSMTDAAGSEIWAYQVDKANSRSVHADQRTTTASPVNITMTITSYLDLTGNVTQLHYPAASGRVVNYTYDNADRPSAAIDNTNGFKYATGWQTGSPTGCVATAVCFTPQGSIYGIAFGPTSTFTGFNITNTYSNRLLPQEFKASSTAGAAIDITYNFVDPINGGNAGHVFSVTNNLNSSRTQSFAYDQLNRIVSAGTSSTTGAYCWGYQFSYDAWGNLTSQAGWSPTYNSCSQTVLPGVTADGNNHISAFAYDASGNATGDGTYTYTWDGESQLKSAAGVSYLYDGDGRRVSKSSGKLYWYGPSGEIIAETDATGHKLNDYIFFAGKHIGTQASSGVGAFYVEDSLGSSRVLTTTAGVVCYDADFTPYGGERAYTNTCTQNNYKFEGKERDTETGNDDFGARYYNNRFGRWLSADWSSVPMAVPYANLTNPQTLDLYAMVSDDPESFADLDGHCPVECEEVITEVEAGAAEGAEIGEESGEIAGTVIEPGGGTIGGKAGGLLIGAIVGGAVALGEYEYRKHLKNPPPPPAPTPPAPPSPPATPQSQAPNTPTTQDSSRRQTRDKHQGDHPSRTGDKLRNKPNWVPKKKSGGGKSKKQNPPPPPPPPTPPPPTPPPPPPPPRPPADNSTP